MTRAWSEDQIEYVRNNHRTIEPKELAKHLEFPTQKVVNFMSKDGLSSARVIYRTEQRKAAHRLLQMGMVHKDIGEVLGCSTNVVYKVDLVKAYKESPKYQDDSYILERKHIEELKRRKLDKFKPKHEEDERFRYIDLSPSEQLIYHSI